MMQQDDFFTPDRLKDIGVGLGQGLQAPNALSAFGAALSGTIASSSERANRAELIALRAADAKAQEEAQIRGEGRKQASDIRGEDRARENLKKDRADNLKYFLDQGVNIFSQGKDSASKAADRRKNSAFSQYFADVMSGGYPRLKGDSPANLWDELMDQPRDKPKDEYQPVASRQGGMTYREATGSQWDKKDVMFDLRKQR